MTALLFSLSIWYDIAQIIIMGLSFVILLGVVRTVFEYGTNDNHRVKVRYSIDSAIIFGIRELFVGWVMLKTDLMSGSSIMLLSLAAIYILVRVRKRVIDSSPDVLEKEF